MELALSEDSYVTTEDEQEKEPKTLPVQEADEVDKVAEVKGKAVYKTVLRKGNDGVRPTEIDTVRINYKVFLEDQTQIFETKNQEIDLGSQEETAEIPEAMVYGLTKMNVGELASISTRPKYSCSLLNRQKSA